MGSSASKTDEPMGAASSLEQSQGEGYGPSTSEPSCPVAPTQRGPVYNVYNQRIDDGACPVPEARLEALDLRNNMPLEPNQQAAPGQLKPLSTSRLQSSIPKGGTDTTWVYPSPQMFYNGVPLRVKTEPRLSTPALEAVSVAESNVHAALMRKNKADDVTEDDMESVVFAHNTMNEITWTRVQMWEALHKTECNDVRLRRFMGRPHDLSPMARLHCWLGGQLPFDRHDWYVDRCGREVRYVIDFYFHEEKAGTPEAFSIRARPAVDSVEAVVDRIKMRIYSTCAKYGLPCPITGHSSTQNSRTAEDSAPSRLADA